MSLRYMSRVLYQAGMRGMQGMKDQASKCDSAFKSIKDSTACSSSKQARRCSSALDSTAFKAGRNGDDKLKRVEESLRTVMYLSCWGPN